MMNPTWSERTVSGHARRASRNARRSRAGIKKLGKIVGYEQRADEMILAGLFARISTQDFIVVRAESARATSALALIPLGMRHMKPWPSAIKIRMLRFSRPLGYPLEREQ
jgi:hypothetical protein